MVSTRSTLDRNDSLPWRPGRGYSPTITVNMQDMNPDAEGVGSNQES